MSMLMVLPLLFGLFFALGGFDFLGLGGSEDGDDSTDTTDTGTNVTGSGASPGGGGSPLADIMGDVTDDILQGTIADNIIDGGAGDDALFGGPDITDPDIWIEDGADSLIGGDGDDTLFGTGDDTLTGGEGADRFIAGFNDALAARLGSPEQAPVVITDFNPAEDTLTLAGWIESPDATDITVEDWQDDTGADVYFGDQLMASVTGAQGLSASDIHAVIPTGAGTFYQQVGTDEADVFVRSFIDRGNQDIVRITHFDPDQDTLVIDWFDGYQGYDLTEGVVVTPWDDGSGADVRFNGALLTEVEGGAALQASDVVLNVTTVFGHIDIPGGDQDDRLEGGYVTSVIDGGEGDDTLVGGVNADTLLGSNGEDILFAYDNAYLLANGLPYVADVLDGGRGDDMLSASIGATMTGGGGEDLFEVRYDAENSSGINDQGAAVITDFSPNNDSLVIQLETAGAVTVADWVDGLGADVLVDGFVVAAVNGGAGLSAGDITVLVS